ncbi:hypothetical protein AB0L63_02280 [Nocardia sp. NPDC051990]|uniref:hypothetical protein n=1 Tax=Nocardia sp. NPDC051990 TaxID=3155285 RepID=UPI003431E4A4
MAARTLFGPPLPCRGVFCGLPIVITGPAGIVLGIISHNKGESLGKWAVIANGAVLAIAVILVIAFIGFLGAFS